MTLREARKKAGLSLAAAAVELGKTKSALHRAETGQTPPEDELLIRASRRYKALGLLQSSCLQCPLRTEIMVQLFPELNNIRRDPLAVAARLKQELIEAVRATDRLVERMSDVDFASQPAYRDAWAKEYEQLVDVERGIEILRTELILQGAHTLEEVMSVHESQQAKCEAHGHHKPTGTEG